MEKESTNEIRFISILNDTTFKYLWKNDTSRNWFIKLIKYITHIDLSEYRLCDTSLNTGNNIMDFICDILFINEDESKTINIEMYKSYLESSKIKSRYYGFRLLSNNMKKGEKYKKHELTQINFYNGYYEKDKDIRIAISKIKNDKGEAEEYINIYDVYLSSYKGICYNDDNECDAMLSFLTGESYEELRKIANGNKEALEIVKTLEELAIEEKFIGAYDRNHENIIMQNTVYDEGKRAGYDKGEAAGIEKGREEGSMNKSIEIAKEMLANNEDIEKISKYTGLTLEEIKELSKE